MSRRRVLLSVFLGYATVLAAVTLTPRAAPVAEPAQHGGFSDFVGNIVLFVPFGLLIPMIWPHLRSLKLIVIAAGICSISIETLQLLVPGRLASASDVPLNILGALTGAVLVLEFLDQRTHKRTHR